MHVTKVLIGVLDWGLDAKAAMELPNLFFGCDGVLIENNAAGQAIAAKMKPFGYSFTATNLGSKLNAIERTAAGWRAAADPRGPGSSLLRSDEHTSDIQSPMRTSYDVFCFYTKIHR